MKTLRDEWCACGRGQYPLTTVRENFLRKYGDYRVVEGELYVSCPVIGGHRQVGVRPSRRGGGTLIGSVGDRVKLILPPEEKGLSLDGAREQILEAQLEATRGREFQERDRADRYEKALREIAERDEEAMPLSTEYQLTKMLCAVATLARGALDDTDS